MKTFSFAFFMMLVVVTLIARTSFAAEKPFKNKTARDAKKIYEKSIEKARKEYTAQLEIAIKEAGGTGDIDDANRLVAEKKRVEANQIGGGANPFEKLRKSIEGTTWDLGKDNLTLRFSKGGSAINSGGVTMAWTTGGKNTLVLQSVRSANIYVWQLSKDLRTAKQTAFVKAKTVYAQKRRIAKPRR